MESTYSPVVLSNSMVFKTSAVDAINVGYREAGDPTHPKLVLLHGWPASSHQYRHLIPKLSDRFHVIAPDYPGFGNSDAPDPSVLSTPLTNWRRSLGTSSKRKGSSIVRHLVLDRLMESEVSTAIGQEHRDSSITPANYWSECWAKRIW